MPGLSVQGDPDTTNSESRASRRSERRAVLCEPLVTAVCSDEEAFTALELDWGELLSVAQTSGCFLSFQWMRTWWDFYRLENPQSRLFILTCRDAGGRMVGILPLFEKTVRFAGMRLRALRLIGNDFDAPDHLDAIVAEQESDLIAGHLLSGVLRHAQGIDLLLLADVADQSVLRSVLPSWCGRQAMRFSAVRKTTCPYVEIAASFSEYLGSLSSSHRYNVRRRGRKLEAQHNVGFEVASRPAEVNRALETLFDLHHKRWAQLEASSKFATRAVADFHRAVSANLAQNEMIRVFILMCDERPVAALYGFVFGNRFSYYQAGFDPDFEGKSVGVVLLARILEYCTANGYAEFDFLRGLDDYKLRWTRKARPTWNCHVAITRRGAAFVGLQALKCSVKSCLRLARQIIRPPRS